MTSASSLPQRDIWQRPYVSQLWKIPLRLRNLSLLKSSLFKKGIAGTPHEVLGTRGRCRLLRYDPPTGIDASGEAVFITPSLINRYYILDLYSGCSFVEALVDRGHRVYLLDWGMPRQQDRFATLEDHITKWLGWAYDLALEDYNEDSLHLFGQCIGGTFASFYAALNPNKVKSLMLLTSPIDFHVEGAFYQWANESRVNVSEMAEVWGNIRGEFLNQTFKMLTPLGDVKQVQGLLKSSWDRNFVKKYAAINEWVSDQVPFPGKAYEKFIHDLYRDNLLVSKEFQLAEEVVDLTKIDCPVQILYAKSDIIVPPESSLALKDFLNEDQVDEVALGGGHIGCVISERHQKKLWDACHQWMMGSTKVEKKVRSHK